MMSCGPDARLSSLVPRKQRGKPSLYAGVLLASSTLVLLLGAPKAMASEGKVGSQETGPGKEVAVPKGGVKLYGTIDALSYIVSSTGVGLDGSGLPSKVARISLGSSAAYSGLRQGDTVLNAALEDSVVILDIDRNGRRYQARIATDVKGLKKEFEGRKIPHAFGESPFDKSLAGLADFEIVLLLDRSQSMADTHAGCPGDLSKWTWCRQQIDNFYLATARILEKGFDLVLFNDKIEERRQVTLWDLKQVFDQVKPSGTVKDLARPIESVLRDYFRTRRQGKKPCLLIVLTDGVSNSGTPLQEVLIEYSKRMSKPGEVNVTFMQVGESLLAEELFEDLERNLTAKGARHHMVHYKPFAQLRNKGLLYEVLQAAGAVRRSGS